MSHVIRGEGLPTICVHRAGDGKLYKPYGIRTQFTRETKQKLFDCLCQLINEKANPEIKQFGINVIQVIKHDIQAPPNFLGSDGLFADDILAEICVFLAEEKDDEVVSTTINHICEQYADLVRTSGFCPSGRTSRLFQIYMFLRDKKDGVHLPQKKE